MFQKWYENINPDRIIACVAIECWLCEKEFRSEDENENAVVKDHCHLTNKFRGLPHINCNWKTRKAQTSIVPILFHNVSGYEFHTFFQKLLLMAIGKGIQMKGEDVVAKSSKKTFL